MENHSFEPTLTDLPDAMDAAEFERALGVGLSNSHGKAEMRRRVVRSAQADNHLFAKGIISFGDGSPNVVPLFHLEFNDRGLISRFVAVR